MEESKGCVTDDGARLRIKPNADEVHVRFCFECDILHVSRVGFERDINFDAGHNHFAVLFLQAFPNGAIIRGIPRKPKF